MMCKHFHRCFGLPSAKFVISLLFTLTYELRLFKVS